MDTKTFVNILALIGGITVVIIGYKIWNNSGLELQSPIVFNSGYYRCDGCGSRDSPTPADYDLVRRAYRTIGH